MLVVLDSNSYSSTKNSLHHHSSIPAAHTSTSTDGCVGSGLVISTTARCFCPWDFLPRTL